MYSLPDSGNATYNLILSGSRWLYVAPYPPMIPSLNLTKPHDIITNQLFPQHPEYSYFMKVKAEWAMTQELDLWD